MEYAYLRTAEYHNRENPETRARKVAEKGLKTGDHKKALDLIVSNKKEEPNSAEAAISALK